MGSPRCASSQSSTARNAVGADDEIAVTEIAMHQRRPLAVGPGSRSRSQRSASSNTGRGQSKQRYSRSRSAISVLAIEVRSFGQFRLTERVNAGRCAAKLARQQRPRLGKLLVAQNLAGDGLAFDPLHDEAGAEIVPRLQHMHHLRRRYARIMRELHQHGFGIEPGRTARRRAIARRRAAQDRAGIAARDARCRTTRSPGWRRRRVSRRL